jgi:hypothetical protein
MRDVLSDLFRHRYKYRRIPVSIHSNNTTHTSNPMRASTCSPVGNNQFFLTSRTITMQEMSWRFPNTANFRGNRIIIAASGGALPRFDIGLGCVSPQLMLES